MQQVVIMDCLDDADISIRLQALELVVQVATSDSLQDIVDRLISQLLKGHDLDIEHNKDVSQEVGSDTSSQLSRPQTGNQKIPAPIDLPAEYRNEVFIRILDICSRDNYSDIIDFEWYVNVLEQLMRLLLHLNVGSFTFYSDDSIQDSPEADIAMRIGSEIRNTAVRVKAIRKEATRTAESFLFLADHQQTQRTVISPYIGALGPAAWVAGEFAEYLTFPDRVLNILINPNSATLPGGTLALYLQAMPKVFLQLLSFRLEYNTSSYAEFSIILARLITFLEGLGAHPDLDVQERATEFLELLRLSKDALEPRLDETQQPPFLLTGVIPGIFKGFDLNSVAIGAQKKVPLPGNLDLNEPINDILPRSLDGSVGSWLDGEGYSSIHSFYYTQQDLAPVQWDISPGAQSDNGSQVAEHLKESVKSSGYRPVRRNQNRDDPFYIGQEDEGFKRPSPYNVLDIQNEDLDIDSIPIIDLKVGGGNGNDSTTDIQNIEARVRTRPDKFEIAADETIDIDENLVPGTKESKADSKTRLQRSLLQVDSSGLQRMTLGDTQQTPVEPSQPAQGGDEELEMAEAMRKIEGLRLKMQRESERANVDGIPPDGTLIKKKKTKKKKPKATDLSDANTGVSGQ